MQLHKGTEQERRELPSKDEETTDGAIERCKERMKRNLSLSFFAIVIGLGVLAPTAGSASPNVCHVPPDELPPELPEPVEACGTVTVAGEETGFFRITLPLPVTIQNPWLTGSSDFSISGDGGFIGFALVEDVAGLIGRAWLGGRLPESADSRLFFVSLGTIGEEEIPSYQVPAGDYRLYLLPGDGLAELTLTLSGLSGRLDLSVRHPVEYELQAPDEYEATRSVPHLYSAGGAGKLDGPGSIFQAVWYDAGAKLVTAADACLWDGPPPEPWRYVPGCTTISIASMGNYPPGMMAGGGLIDPQIETATGIRLFYADVSPHLSGHVDSREWGQSVTVETVSEVESMHSLALWLNFQ